MKNVRYFIVLILFVNCTSETVETSTSTLNSNLQLSSANCINDAPKVKLTNNSSQDFEFIIYGDNYSLLHTQMIFTSDATAWIELNFDQVLAVVYNDISYGQKLELALQDCDEVELEINSSHKLIILGD